MYWSLKKNTSKELKDNTREAQRNEIPGSFSQT